MLNVVKMSLNVKNAHDSNISKQIKACVPLAGIRLVESSLSLHVELNAHSASQSVTTRRQLNLLIIRTVRQLRPCMIKHTLNVFISQNFSGGSVPEAKTAGQ